MRSAVSPDGAAAAASRCSDAADSCIDTSRGIPTRNRAPVRDRFVSESPLDLTPAAIIALADEIVSRVLRVSGPMRHRAQAVTGPWLTASMPMSLPVLGDVFHAGGLIGKERALRQVPGQRDPNRFHHCPAATICVCRVAGSDHSHFMTMTLPSIGSSQAYALKVAHNPAGLCAPLREQQSCGPMD